MPLAVVVPEECDPRLTCMLTTLWGPLASPNASSIAASTAARAALERVAGVADCGEPRFLSKTIISARLSDVCSAINESSSAAS